MLWITSRLGLTVAVGLAALGMTLGTSPAPADAAIGIVRARLAAEYHHPNWNVSVSGVVKMTQTEAQGLIDSGHRVLIRIWGEDLIRDDLLLGPYYLTQFRGRYGYITATPQGLAFQLSVVAKGSELDEDDDPWAPGGHNDEIYAGVRLVNSDGATIRLRETNRLGSTNFGFPFSKPVSTCPVNYVDC
jgi:hypothetical protein